MAKKIKDHVVVVTGASSGIGRATALACAEAGAHVVVIARRKELLESLAAECRGKGVQALVFPADVTDAEAMDHIAAETVGTFGRLDAWVNNAAVIQYGRFEEVPLDEWHRVIEVNVYGTVNGARAAIPWMREQGRGVVVNVASVLSKIASPFQSAYVTSKFAIRGLSDSIRQELSDAPGIDVVTILPGAIDTPFFQHGANHMGLQARAPDPTIDARRVAAAIVSGIAKPRREIVVGASTKLGLANDRLAPGLTEKAAAKQMADEQFSEEPAEPTSGNLFEPMADGDGISGGWQREGKTPAMKVVGIAALAGAAAVGVLARSRSDE
ncbi:MAG TPA: SDR family oxidoreductase [Egibacteraceae bacterium]|nr:SDR family oxidoreductase [Egibacteraceae bacterium]